MDALQKDNLSRELVIALAELNRAVGFDDLETVLGVEASRISDAIGAVREMFIQIEALPSGVTMYSLAPLTRKFALSKKFSTQRYEVLRNRIQAMNRNSKENIPEVTRLEIRIENFVKNKYEGLTPEAAAEAWKIVSSPNLSAIITENPTFRTLRGYVASCLRPPQLIQAREDFLYAKKMKKEPDFYKLKAWREAEKISDENGGVIDAIAEIVFTGKSYTRKQVTQFMQFKANSKYFRGHHRKSTDPTDACKDFFDALNLNLKIYKINLTDEHEWAYKTWEHARTCAYAFLTLSDHGSFDLNAIESIKMLLKLEEAFLDPISKPLIDKIQNLEKQARQPEEIYKFLNKLKGLDLLVVNSDCWGEKRIRDDLANEIISTQKRLQLLKSKA